jgi:glycosyltransferase involved in cell wall biosynthesis
MRILLLAPHDFYIDRGTPMDVDLLARALCARGHRVDLVVYARGEDRAYPGLTILRSRAPRWLHPPDPGFSLRKLLTNLWFFAAARRLVRRNNYDVVHADEEAVFMAMWFRGRRDLPYVYDMDSSVAQQMIESMPWLRPVSSLFDWLERRAIRGALATAPVCNALADLARAAGAAHVVTLYDISQLEPQEPSRNGGLRRELGIDAPVLMYVGNFQKYQGVDLLLEGFRIAVERGCPAHLVLAGGSARLIAAYRQKADGLGLDRRVHFIGPWPAERLGELLAEADVVASPRIRGLNTPMKVFPYLHSGRTLLATDLPTHSQIVTPEIARLARPEPEEFGRAILELMRDEPLRARLGKAAREFVERGHVYAAHQRRVDQLYEYVEAQVAATGRVE